MLQRVPDDRCQCGEVDGQNMTSLRDLPPLNPTTEQQQQQQRRQSQRPSDVRQPPAYADNDAYNNEDDF